MQTSGIQCEPTRTNVLVGAQQIRTAVGRHAITLTQMAIGIGQRGVSTGNGVCTAYGNHVHGHAFGTRGLEGVLQRFGDGRGIGEVQQVEPTTQVVEQEVIGS